MPPKLTDAEIKVLMRFASAQRPLKLLYRGKDGVYLLGERGDWANNIITYLRLSKTLIDEEDSRRAMPSTDPQQTVEPKH